MNSIKQLLESFNCQARPACFPAKEAINIRLIAISALAKTEIARLCFLLGASQHTQSSHLDKARTHLLSTIFANLDIGTLLYSLLILRRVREAKKIADKIRHKLPHLSEESLLIIGDIYRIAGNRRSSLRVSRILARRFKKSYVGYTRMIEDLIALGKDGKATTIALRFNALFPGRSLNSHRLDLAHRFLQSQTEHPFLDAWHMSLCWEDPKASTLPLPHNYFAITKRPLRLNYSKSKRKIPPIQAIQYWSQDLIPDDIKSLTGLWNQQLRIIGLPPIVIYSKQMAANWIASNAPEFSISFNTAYHYAIESDVFRVAYASKGCCIYLDADMLPYHWTNKVLKELLTEESSVLYLRSMRPIIGSCFFISRDGCPFFKRLSKECLNIDFTKLPNDGNTITTSFGVDKFMSVVLGLVSDFPSVDIQHLGSGYAELKWQDNKLLFVNESLIAAASKPNLKYKQTQASWHVKFR